MTFGSALMLFSRGVATLSAGEDTLRFVLLGNDTDAMAIDTGVGDEVLFLTGEGLVQAV